MVMKLNRDMAGVVRRWLDAESDRTTFHLSRVSGVSYATVRRILQEEMTPTLETVLMLLPHIMSSDEARSFLLKHFPLYTGFFQTASCGHSMGTYLSKEDFILLSYARRRNGCRETEAVERLGVISVGRSVEKLSMMGLVSVERGRIVAVDRPITGALDEDFHNINIGLQCVAENEAEEKPRYLVFNGGLNAKGQALAERLVKFYEIHLKKLYSSEDYRGDSPFFAVMTLSKVV